MRLRFFVAVLLAGCIVACQSDPGEQPGTDVIGISSPQPEQLITKVTLSQEETGYVDAANRTTFKLFPYLFKNQGGQKSFVFSPLSLQYALGMTANGASGETLEQIVGALGFGSDIDKLNEFCNKLLNQLPALDKDVTLKLADAIIVNQSYPLQPSFKQLVESTYYAAVENMDFSNPNLVAGKINNWAYRNTNGLIDKLLNADDIGPDAIAFLMNALYLNAPWVPEGAKPLFDPENTQKDDFFMGGCIVTEAQFMHTQREFRHADLGSFQLLEVPYAGGKFAMYIMLPEGEVVGDTPNPKSVYGFDNLISDFSQLDWKGALSKLETKTVNLKLPKFETSSEYQLNDVLKNLGMKLPFTGAAAFDRMFQNPNLGAYIGQVIQKAKISVAEWGTEAAAVTVVQMEKNSGFGPETPVEFSCNHPFAYLIAEKTSGVILFAGAYLGY